MSSKSRALKRPKRIDEHTSKNNKMKRMAESNDSIKQEEKYSANGTNKTHKNTSFNYNNHNQHNNGNHHTDNNGNNNDDSDCGEDTELNRVLTETYQKWREATPLLYEFLTLQELTWPSLTVSWLPQPIVQLGESLE